MSTGHARFAQRSAHAAAMRRRRPDLVDRIRRGSRDERIFIGCLAIIAVHLAVIALAFPGGAGGLARVGLLLAAGAGTAVAGVLFLARGRVARGLLAGAVGLCATAAGLMTSIPHALLTGLGGADLTGILATIAGIVLVVLAFWTALHGRRLAVKLAATIAACFVIAQWWIAPAINAGIATHAPRPPIASASTLGVSGARNVTFPARDRTRLSGWYVPGRNGAAVILLHGSHGTRADLVAHLRMLTANGYAVLAFDARGHGLSSGQANALGWRGTDDVAGAVSFLQRQPGVDGHRIAALGLSMGAEEALRAAAGGIPLRAVIADGAGASTLGDQQLVAHGLAPIFISETWLTMRAIELVSGESEPPPLETVVGRIRVPVLLIATSAAREWAIDNAYRQRIGAAATLWYLPDTGHTAGLSTHPTAYVARATSFLNAALAPGASAHPTP